MREHLLAGASLLTVFAAVSSAARATTIARTGSVVDIRAAEIQGGSRL
jgi:hypothetical protein